jgi:hypothetical protein
MKAIVQEAQTATFIGTGRILGCVAQKERHLAKAAQKMEKIKVEREKGHVFVVSVLYYSLVGFGSAPGQAQTRR